MIGGKTSRSWEEIAFLRWPFRLPIGYSCLGYRELAHSLEIQKPHSRADLVFIGVTCIRSGRYT